MAIAQALRMRLDYIRKPDGQKRGKGNSRKGTTQKKTFPVFPASKATPIDDRAAHERHVKKLAQEFKHGRPNKEVSKNSRVL